MREHLEIFLEIAARWHLTQTERRALLGSPTDERWVHLIYNPAPSCTPDELSRLEAIIAIDAALSMCVEDPREAARWLRTLQTMPPFCGRTPIALLFRGFEGFKSVLDFLKEWHATDRA
jgi:Protein of unknown function (DUF2384)